MIANEEKVINRLHEECRKANYPKVAIRFRGEGNINKLFIYDTEMDNRRSFTVSFMQWDRSMWCDFVARAKQYCEEKTKFSIDRIDAIILTPAKGSEITIIV